MTEPWLEAERREARRDRRQARRPICTDCGRPVAGDQYLPLETGALCEGCIRRRLVEISDDLPD